VHNPPRARAFTECDEFRSQILERVVEARPDLVVMANIYTPEQQVHDRSTGDLLDRRASRRVILDGLRSTLGRLGQAGIPVLLVVDGPASPFDPPTCLADKGRVRPCTFRRPTFTGPEWDAADGFDHVRLLEFTDEVCGAKRCSPVHGRILVYRDTNHLTKTFVLTLTPRFESALAQAPGGQGAASAAGGARSRRP